MKKYTNKVMSVVLALIFILASFSVFPVSATDLDSSLVTHWDFEGTTAQEVFADKATASTVDDTLGVKEGADVTVDDICSYGNGTITNDKLQKRSIQAAHSADIHAISDLDATMFLRFKVDDFGEGDVYITNMMTSFSNKYCGFSLFVSSEGKIFAKCHWNSGSGVVTYDLTETGVVEKGEYINLALTFANPNIQNQVYALVTSYYAIGEPAKATDWTVGTTAQKIQVGNAGTTTNPLSLFAVPVDNGNGNGTVTFDDIRIYSELLTTAEIASILPTGSFDVSIGINLVTHWDFEGTTAQEVFADKATASTVEDTLGVKEGADVTVDDICSYGNGTITNDKLQKRSIQAAHSADIHAISDLDATMFLRFKVDDFGEGDVYITNMMTSFSNGYCGFSLFVSSEGKIFAKCYWNSGSGVVTYDLTETGVVETGEYINLALTFANPNIQNQVYALVTSYYAVGEPANASDWTVGPTNQKVQVGNAGTTTNPLSLFAVPVDNGNGNGTVTFDDIRIYNTLLSVDEIASIIPDGSFDIFKGPAQFLGVQFADVDGDNYNARFVGTLDSIEDTYTGVGFEIFLWNGKATDAKMFTLEDAKVYTTILGSSDSGIDDEISVDGKYLIALTIENIPEDYDQYLIKTFVIDGTTRIYGKTVTMIRPDTWNQ